MSEVIAMFVVLVLFCHFLWVLAGFVVLSSRTNKLVKMRGEISFTDSIYELTFWPVILYRLRKFEAKDG